MDSFEVIPVSDGKRWDEILTQADEYNFYHLSAFHRLAAMRSGGQAMMPVLREGDYQIAFPLMLRDLGSQLADGIGAGYMDATSVAGFAGPVMSKGEPPEEIRQAFLAHLREFLEQNRVVTVYSRLNPIRPQTCILHGCGEIVERGVTLSIDLTASPDEQIARYRRDHRKEIKRLKSMGLTCEHVGEECLDDFMRVYYETMQRVSAVSAYYFDRSYFEYLFEQMPGVMHLFVCRIDGAVACVDLVALCNGIIEGYLAGTVSEHLRLAPSKLVYDGIREWGTQIGARMFHMGGGVAAKRDSLYEFKMGFGAREHAYSTWRLVVDPPAYDEICRAVYAQVGGKPDSDYFPLYRHPGLAEGGA